MSKKKVTKKKTAKREKAGQPTKYNAKYCDMLVEHMGQGKFFETFAAKVDVTATTLYNWVEKHEEFFEAKQRGEVKKKAFWEDAGIAIALRGGTREVSKETVVIDEDGQPVIGPDGKPLVDREFTHRRAGEKAFGIFARTHLGMHSADATVVNNTTNVKTENCNISTMSDEELKKYEEQLDSVK